MKQLILIAAFTLLTGMNILVAQKIQPIPSFDYKLNKETIEFVESNKSFLPSAPADSREKREMEIVISSSSTSPFDAFATVWLVKKKNNMVKGPYTIFQDQQFTKTIDKGEWSVVMVCNFDNIKASVWID
jgi:hypothetical protein